MIQFADPVTFSVPRALLSQISGLSADLTDRLHELLERNTDGQLDARESAELETLAQMAQFSQIVSMALSQTATP
ncbi:MAG TPA: hypothetical protein VHQ47_15225 [Phycisphaerae bacterium]|nr:hypothetical protein [Phycisphaerae bacterium]